MKQSGRQRSLREVKGVISWFQIQRRSSLGRTSPQRLPIPDRTSECCVGESEEEREHGASSRMGPGSHSIAPLHKQASLYTCERLSRVSHGDFSKCGAGARAGSLAPARRTLNPDGPAEAPSPASTQRETPLPTPYRDAPRSGGRRNVSRRGLCERAKRTKDGSFPPRGAQLLPAGQFRLS